MKISHVPNLDSEWLDPESLNTKRVRAPGKAADLNAAPGGASPTPLQRSSRLNINLVRMREQAPASVAGSSSVPSKYHEGTTVRKAFIADHPIL